MCARMHVVVDSICVGAGATLLQSGQRHAYMASAYPTAARALHGECKAELSLIYRQPVCLHPLLHATPSLRTRSGLRPLRHAHPFPRAAVLTLTFAPTALLPSSFGDALLLRCLPRYSGRPLALHTITSMLLAELLPARSPSQRACSLCASLARQARAPHLVPSSPKLLPTHQMKPLPQGPGRSNGHTRAPGC